MVSEKSLKTVLLVGPTASGKSSLAINLAQRMSDRVKVEIINADSVCFYQEFNIGSAKPTESERTQVPHHLIDVVHPNETYHAGQFYRDCLRLIHEVRSRGHVPLVVGGSGFYLKALRMGLWDAPPTNIDFRSSISTVETSELFKRVMAADPNHAKKTGEQDRYRLIRALEIIETSGQLPSQLQEQMPKEPDSRFLLWSIDRDPAELQERMLHRIQSMLTQGWLDEVMRLRDQNPLSKTLHAVGYQQILDYLNGIQPEGRQVKPGLTGLIEEILLAHRQLAKQQRTWIKNLRPDRHFVMDREQSALFDEFLATF
jgi:tRNA dimethylallyltransferase